MACTRECFRNLARALVSERALAVGHGCRACLCPKTANDSVDAAFPIRTDFNMDKARQDAAGAYNKTQATTILREHGLHERDFLFADLPLN